MRNLNNVVELGSRVQKEERQTPATNTVAAFLAILYLWKTFPVHILRKGTWFY